jgi:dTDP-4-amino-4,6-dideoxygalactose transaminase
MTGPAARLRLYTTPRLYADVAWSLLRRNVNKGDDVAALERRIEKLVDVRHAIAMPMARVGIYLVTKHTIAPGQKVILSPYTIADVVNMVICANGVPVFADIDRASCNISAASVAKLIDADTGAVLVTHFYGNTADMEPIQRVCEARGVPLLEDAAQAFGARYGNQAAGTIGRAGVLSFGMYKNINSFYGGMVVTNDGALAGAIRDEIATWPPADTVHLAKKVVSGLITDIATWPPLFRSVTFRLFRWAFLNGVDSINNKLKIDTDPQLKRELPAEYRQRMSPLQARMIANQLPNLEPQTEARIRAAKLYHEGLSDIPELLVAPLKTNREHIYWYYPIQYADRAALVAHVMRQGRDITMSYHRNCASMPCFVEYARDCPNAQATADSLIYLPTYPRYGEEEIKETIRAIRSYFGR